MKLIQFLIDEPLLRRLDADEEVRQVGRSEVLRRAAAAYLGRSHARCIAESYRKTHADGAGLGDEWAGWENQGV